MQLSINNIILIIPLAIMSVFLHSCNACPRKEIATNSEEDFLLSGLRVHASDASGVAFDDPLERIIPKDGSNLKSLTAVSFGETLQFRDGERKAEYRIKQIEIDGLKYVAMIPIGKEVPTLLILITSM